MKHIHIRGGFTLMEIMLVLGILGILASIVLAAINPTKQLNDARGADRSASMREIENAISQYIIDGNLLPTIPFNKSVAVDICQTTVSGTDCTNPPVSGYDLSPLSPVYLVRMPIDPSQTGATVTGYRLYRSGSFNKICAVYSDTDCGPQ